MQNSLSVEKAICNIAENMAAIHAYTTYALMQKQSHVVVIFPEVQRMVWSMTHDIIQQNYHLAPSHEMQDLCMRVFDVEYHHVLHGLIEGIINIEAIEHFAKHAGIKLGVSIV